MDAPPAKPEPTANPVAEPTSDAYATFWQCVDPDDARNKVNASSDCAGTAYEQFWSSFDCD
jgi:hypothetical protein